MPTSSARSTSRTDAKCNTLHCAGEGILNDLLSGEEFMTDLQLVAYERTPSGMHEFSVQLLCGDDKTVSMIMGFFGERMRLVAQDAEQVNKWLLGFYYEERTHFQALRNALCEDVKIRIQATVHPLAIARRQERKKLRREEERQQQDELHTLISKDTRWSRAM